MIIFEMAPALGVIERVTLAGPETAVLIDRTPLWYALTCLVVAGAIMSVVALRRRSRQGDHSEAEQAFAALASKLKIKRREADLIRELALATGAAPVALLLSADLFDQAAGAHPDARVTALRAKLGA